jgi:putative ribosome biogenesis GTPase RsgA
MNLNNEFKQCKHHFKDCSNFVLFFSVMIHSKKVQESEETIFKANQRKIFVLLGNSGCGRTRCIQDLCLKYKLEFKLFNPFETFKG